MKYPLIVILAVVGLFLHKSAIGQTQKSSNRATGIAPAHRPMRKQPNIVFIYADDMGYGDLGCYGAKDRAGVPIATPNIDALASGGLRFTDFYSASPVCSPSRAALLTGRYPIRQGINGVFFPDSYTGLDSAEVTLAETLKGAGYRTGMVGKWHLGHLEAYRPIRHGFDAYFGIPYSNDMTSVVYLRNNTVEDFRVDQRYITQRYTQEALTFIDQHKANSPATTAARPNRTGGPAARPNAARPNAARPNAARPFFLYVAHNMPHIPIYASPDFVGKSGRGLYGDVIQELDWSVGQIMKKLRDSGLEENTLVIFSSDNGPWLVMGEDAGSAGPLREGKQTTFEGGMRVPAIAYWKGIIPAGQVNTDLATMMDWFPTLTKLGGGNVSTTFPLDGEDLWPVLTGTGKRKGQQLAYYNNGKLEAFRLGDWKLKVAYPGNAGTPGQKAVAAHPLLLTNLRQDVGEETNLAEQNGAKVAEIRAAITAFEQSLGKVPPAKVLRTGADNSLSKNRK